MVRYSDGLGREAWEGYFRRAWAVRLRRFWLAWARDFRTIASVWWPVTACTSLSRGLPRFEERQRSASRGSRSSWRGPWHVEPGSRASRPGCWLSARQIAPGAATNGEKGVRHRSRLRQEVDRVGDREGNGLHAWRDLPPEPIIVRDPMVTGTWQWQFLADRQRSRMARRLQEKTLLASCFGSS